MAANGETNVRPIPTHGKGGGAGARNAPVNTQGSGAGAGLKQAAIPQKQGKTTPTTHGLIASSKARGRT